MARMIHEPTLVQLRLDQLSSGTYQGGEYQLKHGKELLPADVSQVDVGFHGLQLNQKRHDESRVTHLDAARVRECLDEKRVVFLGDSRVRFLYAAMLDLLECEKEDKSLRRSCPHHRVCPSARNVYGEKLKICGPYYRGDLSNHSRCLECTSGGVMISYILQRFANQPDLQPCTAPDCGLAKAGFSSPAIGKTDLLFVSNGAWSSWCQAAKHATELDDSCVVTNETTADRRNFLMRLKEQSPDALRIFVDYPTCGWRPLERWETLKVHGFIGYQTRSTTRGWTTSRNISHRKAWSRLMQPWHTLPKAAKWEQCDGAHTFDTLADLEMQILLNAVCK